jgi:hypothetical protein
MTLNIEPVEEKDDLPSRAEIYVTQAKQFVVVTSDDYQAGVTALKHLKKMQKRWDEHQRPAIRAAQAAHKAALKAFNDVNDKYERAYELVKTACERWVTDRRAEQQAAAAAASAAMVPTATNVEKSLGPAFDEAVASGDTAKAARILAQAALPQELQPALPPPPMAQTVVPRVAGVSVSVPWTYEIYDESIIPREYLTVDRKKIAAVVKALKGDTKIPGIHPRPDTSLSIRE